MIDLYQTRTLLDVLEIVKPPIPFVLDTFFGRAEAHSTEYVDIDVVVGGEQLAPFVHPEHQGRLVEREPYSTKSYKIPVMKPKTVLSAVNLGARTPGEVVYSDGRSPAAHAAMQLGKDMAKLIGMLKRAQEWMAVQAVNSGVVSVVGDGYNETIDFGMPAANKVTLTGTDLWSHADSDPISDFGAWADIIENSSGAVPDVAVISSGVARAMSNHASVLEKLDNRRVQMGEIRPERLARGVRYFGYLSDPGIDIYVYSTQYETAPGTRATFMPAGKVFLGATQARSVRHFGLIRDLRAGSFVGEMFPKVWEQEDPSAQYLLLQSACLPVPHQPDAFVSAVVL